MKPDSDFYKEQKINESSDFRAHLAKDSKDISIENFSVARKNFQWTRAALL
jgi:hypothetical protein